MGDKVYLFSEMIFLVKFVLGEFFKIYKNIYYMYIFFLRYKYYKF